MSDSAIITFALIAAVAGIAYGLYLAMWVFKLDAGNAKMQEIAKAIQEGASAYMNRQYKTVGYVAAVLFVVLWGAGAASDKFGLLTAVGVLPVIAPKEVAGCSLKACVIHGAQFMARTIRRNQKDLGPAGIGIGLKKIIVRVIELGAKPAEILDRRRHSHKRISGID